MKDGFLGQEILMNIASDETKILSFPKKRSLGVLYYAPFDQPEEWQLLTQVRGLIVMPENEPIRWELLDEARGKVTIAGQHEGQIENIPGWREYGCIRRTES